MCDKSKSSAGPLLGGLALGAVLGAGAAILFGTKKGREFQSKIKKQYPEVFEKIEGTLLDVKESLDAGVERVEEKVEEVKKEVLQEIRPPKKRFVKNGRKL
ncbi:hypothetical protein A2872_03875 [Candidatus Gottesmanbacteria bacterium RIFCSPHIGHO2_01_FULL_42_12]|uniref:Gas vesicle protein n=1 Tax=Candidatus Gottesmanbacteria bacterium RIFCSPHIGHO2_01_FULL_42_12 TaxID=1798377 RepID=A0A1F5Z4E2_9BACT|nr:MAG: hypothetical protein A2872_03875 [Candidatus Gottesmanbacteria bacterium RIFCSPHIGHO2_01_FULL_42_12]